MDADNEEDVKVKAPRGFIPKVQSTETSEKATHGFFKVFVHVRDEVMIPFHVSKPQETLTVQHFVGIPGMPFCCRVEMNTASPIQYGCRVIIDKVGWEGEHTYDKTKQIRYLKTTKNGSKHNFDDCDHFFWFGPGETSYTVKGYYRTSEEAHEFRFGEVPKGSEEVTGDVDPRELEHRKSSIGVIRFQFTRVKHMVPNRDTTCPTPTPDLGVDFAGSILYKKGSHLSTRSGKRVRDGTRRELVAELENNIVYESVIHFNDIFGYKTQSDGRSLDVFGDVGRLRGIPLGQFSVNPEGRKMLIDRTMLWIRQKRYIRIEEEPAADGRENDTPASSLSRVNDTPVNSFVATEDLVHLINNALSPAASFILCTGTQHPTNFGEKLVQAKPAGSKRDRHFAEKEAGLVKFFADDPTNYELIQDGLDQKNRPLYSVRKAIVTIQDDSDD